MKSTPTIPRHLLESFAHEVRPAHPVQWWRNTCEVTPRLFLSGGLSQNPEHALVQLNNWVADGVTHYIAVHEECDDRDFVESNSNIKYVHIGVDDNGTPRDPRWFDEVATTANKIFEDPNAVVMVTCWMGVNRGPSAAFAILLSLGWKPLPALRAIRTARPIAGIIYAPDAASWWVERNGGSSSEACESYFEVEEWLDRNPLSLSWVIGSIGSRTGI